MGVRTLLFLLLQLICLLLFYLVRPAEANLQQSVIDHTDLPTCSILSFHLPGRVAFRDSDTYKFQTGSYWALNQGDLRSSCRVTPWDVNDLQITLYIISLTNALFAVKSGGHSVVANTSNVEDGIVIDLELLNHVNVNEKLGYIDIGIGARWKDVYEKLDGTGFGVAGARAGSVGVGGYLLGGGLSVYEGTAGWACDSVLLFEVVVANGTLLEVDQNRHPDLFKALKGSGSNLGVVSRARLRLIPSQPDMDISILQYDVDKLNAVLQAVVDYNLHVAKDPLATISVSIGGQIDGSEVFLGLNIILTHPSSVTSSFILGPFFDIPHMLGTQQRMSQYGMALLYDEMNPPGFRQVRTTTTVHSNADCLVSLRKDMFATLKRLSHLNDTNIRFGLLVQPLTLPHLHASKRMSYNILNLENEISPLLLLSSEIRHFNAENADTMEAEVVSFMDKIERHCTQHNQSHKFRYLNYASAQQDVFEHIRQNKELWSWLNGVKQAYDPGNFFGRHMKQPFKILEA